MTLCEKRITKVKCEICGGEFEFITAFHLKKHDITMSEYRKQFPDASLASDGHNKKQSEASLGKPKSEAAKQHMQDNHPDQSGENNPFHGHKHTVESKQKQREAHLGKIPTSKMIDGHKRAGEKLSGRHLTEEHKQHIRDNHPDFRGEKSGNYGKRGEETGMYGKEGWNKGLTKETDDRVMKTAQILSKKMLKNWQDPEFIKMMVNSWYRSGQTKPEKGIDGIVQILYPNEYKFNGNFELGITIGGKIPDFVNVNGKKKAIDMFGDWCHRDDDPQVRIDIFKEYGWDLLVIWEHELKDRDAVIQKIVKFHGVESDYVLTQKTLDKWIDGENNQKQEDKNARKSTKKSG